MVNYRYEEWSTGYRRIQRDEHGHFVKGSTITRLEKLPEQTEVKVSKGGKKYYVDRPQDEKPEMFRMSFIIQNVPVHSTPQHRNYLGFRLQAFHFSQEVLIRNSSNLKQTLLKLTSEYLKYDIYDWNGYDIYIGVEQPTPMNAPFSLAGMYTFTVEKDGSEVSSKMGRW